MENNQDGNRPDHEESDNQDGNRPDHEDSEEELLKEDDEEKIPFTSSEDLKEIVDKDTTVAIVGYVESIESTKLVGDQSLRIFKFIISNGEGERVQVAVWNDQIDRVAHLIQPNCIIHLDCARAKSIERAIWNKGTIPLELSIQAYTRVNILGKHDLSQQVSQFTPELMDMSEIGVKAQYIRVQGYIKAIPRLMARQGSLSQGIYAGSITDGLYKIEFRIPNSDALLDYNDGDHVEILGFAQTNSNPIHIFVKSANDIKKIDEQKMKLKDLLKGIRIPTSNQQDVTSKRMRL